MEKKPFSRYSGQASKGLTSETKKCQDVSNKPSPRNARRREQSTNVGNKNDPTRNNKQQGGGSATKNRPIFDKRPRPRTAPQIQNVTAATSDSSPGLDEFNLDEAELHSVFLPGSKKQNLNHLLNYHYMPRDRDLPVYSRTGNNKSYTRKVKYNKEQFLQANCQFVVKAESNYAPFLCSPDTLVEWKSIEQVHILSSEESKCPICLFPPVAAKMTRCGHVYCWPCILHYLALSDKDWRKCPICFESVHMQDLKSAVSKPYQSFNNNNVVTMELMRRDKKSINITRAENSIEDVVEGFIPHYSDNTNQKLYSKLLLADNNEVKEIIEREQRELDFQLMTDGVDCPESVFIQQALDQLESRKRDICEYLEKCDKKKRHQQKPQELNVQPLVVDEIVKEEEIIHSRDYVIDEDCDLTLHDIDIVPTLISSHSDYYYFYQASDGQLLFLHSINTRMLQSMYGSLENSPKTITGRIMQKESCSMSEDLRKRLKYLQHLPVSCQFEVVEIDFMVPEIDDDVTKQFKAELINRQKQRRRRANAEKIRERKIDEINDRQLGKIKSANINISSTSHFPLCESFENSFSLGDEASNASLDTSYDMGGLSPGATGSVSGPSFAKMLSSTPEMKWPTLPSVPVAEKPLRLIQATGTNLAYSRTNPVKHMDSSDVDEDEDLLAEYQYSKPNSIKNDLSNAIAQAFEKVHSSSTGGSVAQQVSNTSGKKKKNKKTLLFATGMTFNGK